MKGLNDFELFMTLFRNLKDAAGTPQRLVSFHDQGAALQQAVRKLEDFLTRTDFERRVFAGKKRFSQVPPGFQSDWVEYEQKWAPAIGHLMTRDFWPELYGGDYSESTRDPLDCR